MKHPWILSSIAVTTLAVGWFVGSNHEPAGNETAERVAAPWTGPATKVAALDVPAPTNPEVADTAPSVSDADPTATEALARQSERLRVTRAQVRQRRDEAAERGRPAAALAAMDAHLDRLSRQLRDSGAPDGAPPAR